MRVEITAPLGTLRKALCYTLCIVKPTTGYATMCAMGYYVAKAAFNGQEKFDTPSKAVLSACFIKAFHISQLNSKLSWLSRLRLLPSVCFTEGVRYFCTTKNYRLVLLTDTHIHVVPRGFYE